MNLKDARKLRDEVIAEIGAHCTVPLGYGPDAYFARIWTIIGDQRQRDFHSRADFDEYLSERAEHQRQRDEAIRKSSRRPGRTAIEILIDRACDIE